MRSELHADGLAGWVQGEGPPVLLLHGGPGISYEYLDGLAAEIGDGYRVAAFQQRGLAPSRLDGPFDVATAVADVGAVLDALGWERAYMVGHSWGGHLLLRVALALGDRARGALAVDLLGGGGDGGNALFEAEMLARTPERDRSRVAELDEIALRGEGTADGLDEGFRLVWPAYFASPDDTMPLEAWRSSVAAYAGIWESLHAELPRLTASLPGITVPCGVVAGGASPMPVEEAAAATARAIPGAWLDVVEGAGHFPWHERPGCIRRALDRARVYVLDGERWRPRAELPFSGGR
jgi:pimeloyl-ACP methyl ester carboxylesterase